jgi:hypothetical protein
MPPSQAPEQYFKHCWQRQPAETPSIGIISTLILVQHSFISQTLVQEIIGFTVYAIIFGELAQARASGIITH